MRQRAQQLAHNMTQAGITPENEKTHQAYCSGTMMSG